MKRSANRGDNNSAPSIHAPAQGGIPRTPVLEDHTPGEGTDVVDLLDAASYHALILRTEGASPQTGKLYLHYERRFLAYLEHAGIPPTLAALNKPNVRQAFLWWQKHATGTRGGAVSGDYFLRTMRTWSNFLALHEVYATSPLAGLNNVRVAKLERQPYSKQEVLALLAACDQVPAGKRPWPARNRALVYILFGTGMRAGEVATLPLSHIRWDEHRITVSAEGKGRRERSIPFWDETVQGGGPGVVALKAYLKERAQREPRLGERMQGRVWIGWQGWPLTVQGIEQVIHELGRIAGVANAIPHRFRHTMATRWLVDHPGDIMGLRRIMGHVSDAAIFDYIHISQLDIDRHEKRISPLTWLRASGG